MVPLGGLVAPPSKAMILDQMKKMADDAAADLKGAAAEAVVAQKVAKLADAQESEIPQKYLDIMGGFTST